MEKQTIVQSSNHDWYVLKVQTNRESTIRKSLEKKIQRDGLEEYFGRILIPTEKVTETKDGKKTTREHKLYPGYVFVEMTLNDDSWYLVRDISGVGDFTGSMGKPAPMSLLDVEKMLGAQVKGAVEAPRVRITNTIGERVKIITGPFEGFEGSVDKIDEASGVMVVAIEIFGRTTPVEVSHKEIESI